MIKNKISLTEGNHRKRMLTFTFYLLYSLAVVCVCACDIIVFRNKCKKNRRHLVISALLIIYHDRGQSTVASAYTTSVECVQIFNEANMPLHKWATNSAELRELW
ncbi:hypothetical protein TNIN_111301 [Trichonephila inaurata madagascariensis]|uniref:Uncharacterized protein n=1 Tax=Trichonephila inaurata madagascariensis TaxID=2747483 RepID=A0A8X6XNN4_9ARAC|nr:hypothetical protein TNIN_111301 [Trichonephila inaurata madagascariensis]